ncbi:DUF2721 domain-containing protein [Erysipelothrix tonsillarum]|uniref:DUF2721 domain-containing protein n=1 Tax=Erysipelothrix tonsillarum TaxID=38402 RepID=UPI0003753C62|nr:DUF2721 domain-containing protein [Erysipelothrix tonsillarum]
MEFTLQTPAMIFPAISLLMLAYTNRFVVLAGLIRDLYEKHQDSPNEQILAQIINLQKRMKYIKSMQVLGAMSFIGAVLSMLLTMFTHYNAVMFTLSRVIFALSLVLLVISLVYLLKELSISIEALTIQLQDIKNKNKKN